MLVKRAVQVAITFAWLTNCCYPAFSVPSQEADFGTSDIERQADDLLAKLKQLESKVDASSQKISLNDAIELGIRNSPDLISTFRSIQQYEWQLIAAKRKWYPTLEFENGTPFYGLSATTYIQKYYNSERETVSSDPGSEPDTPSTLDDFTTTSTFQPGMSFTWSFIDPTRQPDINAASEALRQQKLLFDVSARNLILDIQTAYYSLQSTRQLIREFSKIYDINRRQLEIIRARYNIRQVTVLDLAQTQTQLFNQLNQLIAYTKKYISESAQLTKLLGMPSDTLVLPDEDARLYQDWTLPLVDTIERAAELREETLASLAAAESAQWSGLSKMNAYLPVFQVVGYGSLELQSGVINGIPGLNDYNTEQESLLKYWDGAIGLGFSWLLFDGGIEAADAKSSYAEAEQERSLAQSKRLQSIEQVRSSYGAYRTSSVAVDAARLAYKSALKAQEAARARFEIGLGDMTTIVQTIEQLGTSSQQLSEAILAYNTSVAQLYRYSATWPGGSDQLVRQQEKQLR